MKAKEYPLLVQAVTDGVHVGWNRAHKHVDAPEPEAIQEDVIDEVIGHICEAFDFEPTPVDDPVSALAEALRLAGWHR